MDEKRNVALKEGLEGRDGDNDNAQVDLDEAQDDLWWQFPCVVETLEHGKGDGKSSNGDSNDGATSCKEKCESQLLTTRNLQRLDDPEGDNHYKGIDGNAAGDKIDDKDFQAVAFILLERVPACRDRPASEYDHQDVGEAVGAHESHAEVYCSTDEFIGRDAEVKGENGEFGETDTRTVDKVRCCTELPKLGNICLYSDVPCVIPNAEF